MAELSCLTFVFNQNFNNQDSQPLNRSNCKPKTNEIENCYKRKRKTIQTQHHINKNKTLVSKLSYQIPMKSETPPQGYYHSQNIFFIDLILYAFLLNSFDQRTICVCVYFSIFLCKILMEMKQKQTVFINFLSATATITRH